MTEQVNQRLENQPSASSDLINLWSQRVAAVPGMVAGAVESKLRADLVRESRRARVGSEPRMKKDAVNGGERGVLLSDSMNRTDQSPERRMLTGTTIALTVRGKPRQSAAPLLFSPRKRQSLPILPRSKNLASRNFGGRRGTSVAVRPAVLPRAVPVFLIADNIFR